MEKPNPNGVDSHGGSGNHVRNRIGFSHLMMQRSYLSLRYFVTLVTMIFSFASYADGTVEVDITSILGRYLPARIDFLPLGEGDRSTQQILEGHATLTLPAESYRAYIHVYSGGVPVLVEIKDIEVKDNESAFLLVNLLEGASNNLVLREFDLDGDLAIDRVEIDSGTDPENAASIPGKRQIVFNTEVIEKRGGWYSGELFAQSDYGEGTESVGKLISRAEKSNMDFLAIADLGTVASTDDKDYKSGKLVLIPALQWGSDQYGRALIYGPRTLPDPPFNAALAQAECIRVQVQGGVFAVAHPCLPTAPWTWGLSYVNAVQVWFRDWRMVPPITLEHLAQRSPALLEREGGTRDGRLVQSIAAAALPGRMGTKSANAQATLFYDYELMRGLMASAIGGSGTASKKVPMGQPLTYIRAKEKSLPAILEGLRLGRTYVTAGPNAPKVSFRADVLNDGKMDVDIGGVVPINVDTMFEVLVENGEGLKLQVVRDGETILSKVIEGKGFGQRFIQHPTQPAAFRVRVVGEAENEKEGFGPIDVYAQTSPIYAQDIALEVLYNADVDVNNYMLKVHGDISEIKTDMFDMPTDEQMENLPADDGGGGGKKRRRNR